jgi:amino acid transporter
MTTEAKTSEALEMRAQELEARVARLEARADSRASRAVLWTRDVRLLLIALWLGGALFFSIAVAPSAFGVLPTRELAGRVVSRTLTMVNVGGLIVSLLLLATAFVGARGSKRCAFYMELAALGVVAATTAAGQWIIGARLLALRAAMGRPVDELAQTDPLRVAFGNLHGYSVLALGIGMLAALAAFLLMARRNRTV